MDDLVDLELEAVDRIFNKIIISKIRKLPKIKSTITLRVTN